MTPGWALLAGVLVAAGLVAVAAGLRGSPASFLVPMVLSTPDSAVGKELGRIADVLSSRRRGLAGMSLGLDPTRRA